MTVSVEVRSLGLLSVTDPLHRLLAERVLPDLRGSVEGPCVLDVEQLSPLAYRYRERATGVAVVAKFFGNRSDETQRQVRSLHAEFANLERLRALGFDRSPFRVVRPLATAPAVNAALILEAVTGRDLLTVIREDAAAELVDRVAAVSDFLAALHERTRTGAPVDPHPALGYLGKVTAQLDAAGLLDPGERAELHRLCEAWQARGALGSAGEVLIHGDATPRHFLFAPGEPAPGGPPPTGVTAIDLERLGPGDPVADVGRLAAELKHLLLERTGDPSASQPAIARLYAAYTRRAGIPPAAFSAVTERGRFYMGRDLLRIARNGWIDHGQRRRLVGEALACLRD
jgi:aminoglycoside phosphotransferase (APT) family kinase protein